MARSTALCTLVRNSPPQRRNCALPAALSMRIEMRMVCQAVEGLVELARVAAGADSDQRQQSGVPCGVGPGRGRHEAAQLRQRVVEDVGQSVAVVDQVLGDVEPPAAVVVGTFRPGASTPSSLGITVRVKKSAFTSITLAANRIASSAASSSTHARGLLTAMAMADKRSSPRSPKRVSQSISVDEIC